MATHTMSIDQLVLNELAGGERRVLSLTVAVRHMVDRAEGMKGDLPGAVKASVRKLVAARLIRDEDGVYSLSPQGHEGQAANAFAPAESKRGRARISRA